MPPDRAGDEQRPIRCPYCAKVTDHTLSLVGPGRSGAAGERPLEPADPPLGTRHVVVCLTCRLLHSWWARRPPP